MTGLSIILPAHNEAAYLPACIEGLARSEMPPCPVELIVVVNGSSDATYEVARAETARLSDNGWQVQVLDVVEGGKINALNIGDRAAGFEARIYLDADVVPSKGLLAALWGVLASDDAVYGSGRVNVVAERSWISRAYAAFYAGMPFIIEGVPGCGLFAVNAAARKRWGAFPDIISDDTFVRLHFTPAERVEVAATYSWPVVEGFAALVRVRRRQDRGVAEIREKYPTLEANDDQRSSRIRAALGQGLRHPLGFLVYFGVSLAVKLSREGDSSWVRGR